MAFKTFAPGVLTSSDVNTFLMQQAVITCTSSTRPSSPIEGMTIYETDNDRAMIYDGSNWVDFARRASNAWTSWTPTLSGTGWAVGNGTIEGYYTQIGLYVVGWARWTTGSTSTYGSDFGFDAPVAMSQNSAAPVGIGRFVDDSGNASFQFHYYASGSAMRANVVTHNNAYNYTTATIASSTVPVTWQTDDRVGINFAYRAA